MLRDYTAMLLAAGLLMSAAAPARADDNDGWRTCAEEGQTCRVSGRAIVRYGENGRWITRSIIGGVECGNEAFGDPAPNVPKRCEVHGGSSGGSHGSGAAGWTFCAAEGEICQFRGQAEVRFGQGRDFSTRTAYGSVRCDVSDFGDPAYGVTKYCEVRSSQALNNGSNRPNAWGGWGNASASSGWRYCAAEGSTCRVQGSAAVRFGDGRRFNTRSANGQIECNTDTFGDPAYGTLKHCEVKGGNTAVGDQAAWRRCAGEGERCDFSGTAQVRYGTNGRYVYRDAWNGVGCDTRAFGSDPYEGRVKSCEIRR